MLEWMVVRITFSDRLSATLTDIHLPNLLSLNLSAFLCFFQLSLSLYVYMAYHSLVLYFVFFLQVDPNLFPVEAVPLSVLITCGIPFKSIYCSKKVFAVFLFGASHIHAAGHLLYRLMETKIKNLRCLNLIGPMKSNWISSFSLSVGGK